MDRPTGDVAPAIPPDVLKKIEQIYSWLVLLPPPHDHLADDVEKVLAEIVRRVKAWNQFVN